MKNRRKRKRDGKGKWEGRVGWRGALDMSVELQNRKVDVKRKEEESGVEGNSFNGFLSSCLLHGM